MRPPLRLSPLSADQIDELNELYRLRIGIFVSKLWGPVQV